MGIENQHSFLQYDKIVSEGEAYETLGMAIIITAARDLKLAYKRLRRAIICRHSTSCQRHSRAERLWAYAFLLLALSPKWYVNSDTLLWCHLFPLSTSTTTPSRNSLPKPTTILPHLSSILAEVVQSPLL